MSGVFINYRGADSETAAALIDRELVARFGGDRVFIDNRSIPAGVDFVEELLERLRACSVLLVVIGPRWLAISDAAGQRRIDDPTDWVRREIAEALSLGLRVIPVLTDDVALPSAADLADDIAGLSQRQPVPLRRRYTGVDLAFLVEQIIGCDPGLAAAAACRATSSRPAPRQLVAAPRLFTGRKEQLAALTRSLDGRGGAATAMAVCVIGGPGGIGKTALALHWAHQVADRFPDGQLYVNLRGFEPTGSAMDPAEALRQFLDALQVPPARIPVELDAMSALYRSQLAGRRMLVLLDNARSTEQVEPLLPGDAACAVLVTSRRRLVGLISRYGADHLRLDELADDDAREMLVRQVGVARAVAEPAAVTELLAWCAGLPLAVGIAAARAGQHPEFPLAVLAEELRTESARLDAFEGGELTASLRAVFSWSYHALDRAQAEAFGLLGLAPGPDVSGPCAASLTGLTFPQVRAVLDGLERASLAQQHVPGRYRMHDLIRLFAGEQAHRDQSDSARESGLRRVVDFYLHTAHAAQMLLDPHRDPIDLAPPSAGCHPHHPPDEAAAFVWFEAEHLGLLAAQRLAVARGWHPAVWQLAWTMTAFHIRRGHRHDQVAVWQAGLSAAHQTGNPSTVLRAHRRLGHACANIGRHADALDHLDQALTLAQDTGDLLAQAHTHTALAKAWEQQGDDHRALEHATSSLRLFQNLDLPVWEADMLNVVGWHLARLGRHEQARTHCEAALTLARRHHERACEASALDSLGYLAHHTGQLAQAQEYYQQAITLCRDLGFTDGEDDILDRLGQTQAALGHHDQARHAWQQAIELYQAHQRTADADRVQQQLDRLGEP